jgi:hypothetical protein
VIAGQQNCRDVDAAEHRRPRVGWVIQVTVNERFRGARLGGNRAVDEPNRGIQKRHRRDLAAGEDKVAEGTLFDRIEGGHTLIDPFVMAADEHEAIEFRECGCVGMGETRPGRRRENDPAPLARTGLGDDAVDDARQRFDAEHHSGSTAERAFVGPSPRLARPDDIVHANGNEAAFDGAADDREADDRGKHFREKRNDLDVQHWRMSFFARLFGPAAPVIRTPFDAGVAALARRRHDEALAHFAAARAAAADARERGRVHNKRALTFLDRGDRAAAVDAFAQALDADERCVPAIVNVGNLLLEDRVFDDAIAHYEAALRIDDTYAAAHLNLGIAFKRLGRQAEAVREFRRADRIEARLRAPRP